MQHEVFRNPGPRTRLIRPFLAVLQADVVDGPSKLVCPLYRTEFLPASRTAPLVIVLGDELSVGIEAIFALRSTMLRSPVASIAAYRDDIVSALDWLFTGL